MQFFLHNIVSIHLIVTIQKHPFFILVVLLNSFISTGNAILLESDIHIVRCCGVLTKIELVARSNGTITFAIWRPTFQAGEKYVRTVVGIHQVTVSGKLVMSLLLGTYFIKLTGGFLSL